VIPGTPSSIPGSGNMTPISELASGTVTAGFGFRWQGVVEIQQNITKMGEQIEESRRQVAEMLAQEMQDWAQANAKWKDVTGAARQGLTGYAEHDDAAYISRAIIAHTVDYGLWLEVRAGGSLGIILPTVLHFADQAEAVLGLVEI
jgi:hypothetical protein